MKRRLFLLGLAAVVLLGAYLRLNDLSGPSLWLDEILHLEVVGSLAAQPWHQFLTGVREIKGGTENGALYYGLQLLGQKIQPGDPGVRLLPAIVGTLTLGLMAFAGSLLAGRTGALTATFLLAVAPLHVYFSREGRPYYLLITLALVLTTLLLAKGSRAATVTAWISCLALAYVGLQSIPTLVSFATLAVLLWLWQRRAVEASAKPPPYLNYLLAALVGLAIAYALYFTRSETNYVVLGEQVESRVVIQNSPVFQSPLTTRSLERFFASMTTSGHESVLMNRRSWALIVLALLAIVLAARTRTREAFVAAGMFVLPASLSIMALLSVGRWYNTRYTSAALPGFLLLLTLGIIAIAETFARNRFALKLEPRYRNLLSLLIVSGLVLFFVAPNLGPARADPYRKLDWRAVAEFFDEVALEDEPIVVPNDWPKICLDHYLEQLGRSVEFVSAWESADLGQSIVDERERGWLLTAGFRRSNEVRAWMHGYVPVLRKPEEEMALFFFPDFETLLETRFAAGKGSYFVEQFEQMNQRFDFAGESSTLLGEGWSYPENDGQGTSFRWALGSEAVVALPTEGKRKTTLRLRALPFVYPGASPQSLELSFGQEPIATLELTEGWNEHEVDIPDSSLGAGPNILYLRFARSTAPASVLEGSGDNRQLSAAFDYLEIVERR